MSWVRKKTCNSKLERNAKNKPVYDLVDRASTMVKRITRTKQLL